MKKAIALSLTIIFVLAFSACSAAPSDETITTTVTAATTQTNTTPPTSPTTTLISRDRAIEIALQAAGVAQANVRDLEAELDREPGGVFWEVDFEAGGYDYAYDIDAKTGNIFMQEREIND